MPDEPVDEALRDFILAHFDSIVQLEALLLLHGHAGRSWSIAEVAGQLYVPTEVAAAALGQLETDGLIGVNGQDYRYAPRSEEMAAMVERLARTYSRALIPVTNLVHGNPRRLRRFADAFRLRKEK
ncbi:MAG TPA: hypothetical protein VFB13_00440 [Reyranella sp.]|nr:hypothetical protein [Reyranella sp.]